MARPIDAALKGWACNNSCHLQESLTLITPLSRMHARAQVTPEVAAHLKEAGVDVKPYEGLPEDVHALASSGSTIWADPAKARPGCACL